MQEENGGMAGRRSAKKLEDEMTSGKVDIRVQENNIKLWTKEKDLCQC